MLKEPQRDCFASVTDLAGSIENWFRDTSVDPKRCSRVVACCFKVALALMRFLLHSCWGKILLIDSLSVLTAIFQLDLG